MEPNSDLLHIFLVRHYEPNVERSGFFNAREASRFISAYDEAGIKQLAQNLPTGLPQDPARVYCSALPRAKQTARILFGEKTFLIEDPNFNEFQRKIFHLPLLRFPIEVWLTGARLLWIMGLNSRGIETFREARSRAFACAETLERYAQAETKVVLVAHGFLNAFIRQGLRKRGWQVLRHDGNDYLGVTELVKSRNPE